MLLPFPHAASRLGAAITSKQNPQRLRRVRSELTPKMQANKLSGRTAARNLPRGSRRSGIICAVIALASIVSVALSPGLTDAGEMSQDGMGSGPATEQERATSPEKPFSAAIDRVSVTLPPRATLRLVAVGLNV